MAAVALVAGLVSCGGGDSSAARDGADPRVDTTAVSGSDQSTTPPSTDAPTTTSPGIEITLAFAGDLLPHLPLVEVAGSYGEDSGAEYDFGPMLEPMAPVVGEVDLAVCHMEVPIVADGQSIAGYPSFHAPRELANAIDSAGYDGCSTASNHSLDGGLDGITATLDAFDKLGLGHTGTARSEAEATTPRLYDVGGATVAHLSYSYGFNGYELPEGAPWAANLIDVERITADASAAREAGAHLVVVSAHWGSEYQSNPDGNQEFWAPQLAAIPDVDLVIGHHAHVVQPIERVGRTWVVYGLGNQLANQEQLPRRDGLTVLVTARGLTGGRLQVTAIEAVPTYVDLTTFEVQPVAETLADTGLSTELRAELEASLDRTMEAVNRRGAGIRVHAWT